MHHGHHLTPAELAKAEGLTESDVLRLCVETAVPVLHGRIDRSLFDLAVGDRQQQRQSNASEVLLSFD